MGQGKKEEAEAKKQEVNKYAARLEELSKRERVSKQKFREIMMSFQILLIHLYQLVKMTVKMLN